MWTSVGSVGIVNIPDISKIVFDGAVVQLGVGGGPVGSPASAEARAERLVSVSTTSAVVRYSVNKADVAELQGPVGMKVRYRDGTGKVLIQLIKVPVATGAETVLLSFDSTEYTPSNNFHAHVKENPNFPSLDFTQDLLYVVLTLTGPGGPEVTNPPAVNTIQIMQN